MAESSKPRCLWANDAGDIFMRDAGGRIFELDRGASLVDDGLPIDDSLTAYTPTSDHDQDLSGMSESDSLMMRARELIDRANTLRAPGEGAYRLVFLGQRPGQIKP